MLGLSRFARLYMWSLPYADHKTGPADLVWRRVQQHSYGVDYGTGVVALPSVTPHCCLLDADRKNVQPIPIKKPGATVGQMCNRLLHARYCGGKCHLRSMPRYFGIHFLSLGVC